MRSIICIILLFSFLNPTLATSNRQLGIVRRDICSDNYQMDCDSNCMPAGARCCNDGSGTYCPSGETCVPNGCCPVGQHCGLDGGGTQTIDILTGTGTFPTATRTVTAGGTVQTAGGAFDSASHNPELFVLACVAAGQLILA